MCFIIFHTIRRHTAIPRQLLGHTPVPTRAEGSGEVPQAMDCERGLLCSEGTVRLMGTGADRGKELAHRH